MNRRDLLKMVACLGTASLTPASVLVKDLVKSEETALELIRPIIRLRGEVAYQVFNRPGCDFELEPFTDVHHCVFHGARVMLGQPGRVPARFCDNLLLPA